VPIDSMSGVLSFDFAPPTQSGVKKLRRELVTPLEDVCIERALLCPTRDLSFGVLLLPCLFICMFVCQKL